MADQAAPKILIPLDRDLCHKWDTMAARCRLSRHEWIVLVLGHIVELNPAPIMIDKSAKIPNKGISRVNIRATDIQLTEWQKSADKAHMPLATWARAMISAAADAELSQYMRRRFVLAEHCATNDRPKHQ